MIRSFTILSELVDRGGVLGCGLTELAFLGGVRELRDQTANCREVFLGLHEASCRTKYDLILIDHASGLLLFLSHCSCREHPSFRSWR